MTELEYFLQDVQLAQMGSITGLKGALRRWEKLKTISGVEDRINEVAKTIQIKLQSPWKETVTI